MTPSQTTFWGAVAGAATAAQALPNLPWYVRAGAAILAGLALGALGYHSSDCPPNCPGTDSLGKRRLPSAGNALAGILLAGGILLALTLVVMACGCTALYGHAYQRGDGTNAVAKAGATLYGVTFFDSGQVLGKARLAFDSGTNGRSAGSVAMSGVQQSSSSTGVVTIIQQFQGMTPIPLAPAK